MINGRNDKLCGDSGVSRVHGTLGAHIGPPAVTPATRWHK